MHTLDDLVKEGQISYWTKWTDLDENSRETNCLKVVIFQIWPLFSTLANSINEFK